MILGEPVILGGGNGIACVLIISTDPGARVTCNFGNTEISKTANADGKAVFELKKAGVWTVTASLDGETVSKEIDTSLALETEIDFINADPVLENNSWETISKVAKKGEAQNYWNIGDTKKVTINGVTYETQIIDFDHNDVTDPTSYGREKAGITFQMKNSLNPGRNIHGTGTMTGGWASLYIRTNGIPEIITQLETELQDVLLNVETPYGATYNATSLSYVSDKLFLPSEWEVFGYKSFASLQEGNQFAYYAAGNSRVKTIGDGGGANLWYTRSYFAQYPGYFCTVDQSGNPGYIAPNTNGRGVSLCFCV